ncbi:hypothetical protein HDR60_05930 [bacterium]|nr:hypothetical protein [bacterium]
MANPIENLKNVLVKLGDTSKDKERIYDIMRKVAVAGMLLVSAYCITLFFVSLSVEKKRKNNYANNNSHYYIQESNTLSSVEWNKVKKEIETYIK